MCLIWRRRGDNDRNGGIGAKGIILEMSLEGSCAMEDEIRGGIVRDRKCLKAHGRIAYQRHWIGRVVLNVYHPFGPGWYV